MLLEIIFLKFVLYLKQNGVSHLGESPEIIKSLNRQYES